MFSLKKAGDSNMRGMKHFAILSIFPLAACQTSVPPPAEPEVYFTARGNEPGWIVRFDTENIVFEGDYGDTKITVTRPEGRPSFNGMRYVSDRLTVDVTHATCADGMSGERYADTVTVFASGQEYEGCGGRKLPPETLDGTSWTIVMMDQIPVLADVPTALRFADGRVSGSGGCNSIGGSYTTKGSSIVFSDIIATETACVPERMAQEAKLLSLLSGKVTTRFTVNGDLILTNESGQRATFRRVI
jgi:heat shock protein HslJ